MTRDPWVNALVASAKELFADDIDDPSAEELVDNYYGGNKIFPAAVVDDAVKRMSRIRHELESDGYRTAPLAKKYYRRGQGADGRPAPVTSLAEAALQLASGYGKRTEGLAHFTGQNESLTLIWRAWQKLQSNRNGAALGKDIQRVLDAVASGELSDAQARATLETGVLAATPDSQVLGRVMMAQLDSGAGDDE